MITSLASIGLIVAGTGIYNILKGDSKSSASEPVVHEEPEVDYYNDTLDYCYYLTEDELIEYVEDNYDLYKYRNEIDFSNGKYRTCKDIALLAEKLQRPFTNRFSRY